LKKNPMNWNWYISVAAVQDVMRTAGWRVKAGRSVIA